MSVFSDVDHPSFIPDNVNTAESLTLNPDHMMEVDKVAGAGSSVDGTDHMSWSGDSLDHSLRTEEVPVTARGDHSSNTQCKSPVEKRQRLDDGGQSPRSPRSSPRLQTGDDHSESSGKGSSLEGSGRSPDHKEKGKHLHSNTVQVLSVSANLTCLIQEQKSDETLKERMASSVC